MGRTWLNDLEFKLVQQRTDLDCGVAVAAMYARVSYEEMDAACQNLFGPVSGRGLTAQQIRLVLKGFNMDVRNVFKFFDGVPCIVGVPSINFKASMHWVFWDANTRTVLDPQAQREGRMSYDREMLYRGWSDTVIDMRAAHEGFGGNLDKDYVLRWALNLE